MCARVCVCLVDISGFTLVRTSKKETPIHPCHLCWVTGVPLKAPRFLMATELPGIRYTRQTPWMLRRLRRETTPTTAFWAAPANFEILDVGKSRWGVGLRPQKLNLAHGSLTSKVQTSTEKQLLGCAVCLCVGALFVTCVT